MAKGKRRERTSRRKELKKPDVVLGTMDRAVEWISANRRAVLIGVLVICAATFFYFFWQHRTKTRRIDSAKLFKKALRVYTAIIDPALTKPKTPEKGNSGSFKTVQDRARAALEAFNKVVSEYSGESVSRAAHLYRGNCYVTLKRYKDAVAAYKKVLRAGSGGCGGGDGKADSLTALATENLAYALVAQGKYSDARTHFAKLSSLSGGTRQDWQYYHTGRIKEMLGDLPGAIRDYKKIKESGKASKGSKKDPLNFFLSPLNPYASNRARYLERAIEIGTSGTKPAPPGKPAPGPAPMAMTPAPAPMAMGAAPAPMAMGAAPAPMAMGAAPAPMATAPRPVMVP